MHVFNDRNEPACGESSAAAGAQQMGAGAITSQETTRLIYNLRLDADNSDRFFAVTCEFTDRVLEEIDGRAGALIEDYAEYVARHLREAERSRGEYGLDLLILGLALGRYMGAAESTPRWAVGLANEFSSLRREAPWTRGIADQGRAVLNRLFLGPRMGKSARDAPFTLGRLWRLIEWLQATGEFEQEIRRLNNWRSFLGTMKEAEANFWMTKAIEVVDWFEASAAEWLGEFTGGVAPFLKGEYAHRGLREDQVFCGRQPLEYHLAMVAAEVMNRGLRQRFEGMRHRVVLLPTCMRKQNVENCRARDFAGDLICSGCDPQCGINRITEQMHLLGAEVYMIPHATSFSRSLARWQHETETGVVAVACLLNILPGGLEMRARRIPSQCVPLDFPGCQRHWQKHRFTTGVNEERLAQIVRSRLRTN